MKLNTCRSLILASLADGRALAIHEMEEWMRLRGFRHSGSAISARQRELAKEGLLKGQKRKDKPFKEWARVFLNYPIQPIFNMFIHKADEK